MSDSPIMASIRQAVQQIEDSRANVICSRADEERVRNVLGGLVHRVNVHVSQFCEPGQVYVTKSMAELMPRAEA